MIQVCSFFRLALIGIAVGLSSHTLALAQNISFSDVSVRSFSVLVTSDVPLSNASVRVFTDELGTSEVTGSLAQNHVTSSSAASLTAGLAKVDVTGAAPEDTLYAQAVLIDENSNEIRIPAAAPFPAVTLMRRTGVTDSDGSPLSSALLVWSVESLDGAGVLPGAIVTLEAPAVSAYPISGVVDPVTGNAILDLANLYAAVGSETSAPEAGDAIQFSSLRGLTCPLLEGDVTINWRRVPTGPSAQNPNLCFAPSGLNADYDCDGTIGLPDYNRFVSGFGTAGDGTSCAFNRDFDLARLDRLVGSADFNLLLSVFGATE